MTRLTPDGLAAEVSGALLGDARRSKRLASITERAARSPDMSFPEMASGDAELEAFYRFFGNESLSPDELLAPHVRATVARCAARPSVVVAHDTTQFHFSGERKGLGRLAKSDHGFWAHVALAMTPERESLGVLGLLHGTRHGPPRWKDGQKALRPLARGERPESLRWIDLSKRCAELLTHHDVVHVMDREADWYALMASMLEHEQKFVIRMCHDRATEDGHKRVSAALNEAPVQAERTVQLSGRPRSPNPRQRKRHPARTTRLANLSIRACSTKLRASEQGSPSLDLNLVQVLEVNPPDDQPPVQWTLLTTEPIEDAAAVLRVVDLYRARWTIEEFFKAIKTGCAFEKRQLGSYHGLVNALAVFLPVAWMLLRLRDTGRTQPDAPAAAVLPPELLEILLVLARRPLPENPTARDAMYAVAGLGGHLPRNGDPGWQTLGRGFERLLEAQRVRALLRSDQS